MFSDVLFNLLRTIVFLTNDLLYTSAFFSNYDASDDSSVITDLVQNVRELVTVLSFWQLLSI